MLAKFIFVMIVRHVTGSNYAEGATVDFSQNILRTPVYAGYTNDENICEKYNENLEGMWTKLKEFVITDKQPDNMALHNLVLIITSYLDHIPTSKVNTDDDKPKLAAQSNENTIHGNEINYNMPLDIFQLIINNLKDLGNKKCHENTSLSLLKAIIEKFEIYVKRSKACHKISNININLDNAASGTKKYYSELYRFMQNILDGSGKTTCQEKNHKEFHNDIKDVARNYFNLLKFECYENNFVDKTI